MFVALFWLSGFSVSKYLKIVLCKTWCNIDNLESGKGFIRDAWILQQGKVRWDLNFSLFNSWSVNYYLKCTWRVKFSSVRAWNETRAPPPPSLPPCCPQFSVAWKALSFISFLNRRLTSIYGSELVCYQIMQGGLFVWKIWTGTIYQLD